MFKRFKLRFFGQMTLVKIFDYAFKVMLLMALPLPATIFMGAVWYYAFFRTHFHLPESVHEIATAGWIPVFGILYALFSTVVVNKAFDEYKQIRYAIKRGDIDSFMELRDEDVSPVAHALMSALALAVLVAFMMLTYPSAIVGLYFICSTTYLFALLYWVVIEVDNPCTGIWTIRFIHDEWKTIDPKAWRERKLAALRTGWKLTVEVTAEQTPEATPPAAPSVAVTVAEPAAREKTHA